MNPRTYYAKLIDELPAGAERFVGRILCSHIGLANAIQKSELIERAKVAGVHFTHERQARLVIIKLRKRGMPICSSSGESGYYLAASLDEYRQFRAVEYVSKIKDMRETVDAMDAEAKQLFEREYRDWKTAMAESRGQPMLIGGA